MTCARSQALIITPIFSSFCVCCERSTDVSNRVERGEKTGTRKRFTRYANYMSVFITSLFIYLLEILLDIPVYNIEINIH
jgi:hypothetical protein